MTEAITMPSQINAVARGWWLQKPPTRWWSWWVSLILKHPFCTFWQLGSFSCNGLGLKMFFKKKIYIPSLLLPSNILTQVMNFWSKLNGLHKHLAYRNYMKTKAFAAEGHVHMCCQGWGIQAGILVNRDILRLGRDTKRLPTDLRQHLDTTFCSDHVSIIVLLKAQSHPQTAWVIPPPPKMLFGKPTTLFIICPVDVVDCNPRGLWVVL